MLKRQKTVLCLLTQVGRPLSPTVFVKLVFLLRQETELERDPSFYDFVPYKRGPFSFTLYCDLRSLRKNGYVAPEEEHVALCNRTLDLTERKIEELPVFIHDAVTTVLDQYGKMRQPALVQCVYSRYPWFARNSELLGRDLVSVERPKKTHLAIYTAGYEGRSIDAFLNNLLKKNIEVVIDVRANPVSRKYGFSGSQFRQLSGKLGIEYRHVPCLGIPSSARAGLGSFASYQHLLDRYEDRVLPEHLDKIDEVGALMKRRSSVLVCVEKDVRCCHRSRLAEAVAKSTGLEVIHL